MNNSSDKKYSDSGAMNRRNFMKAVAFAGFSCTQLTANDSPKEAKPPFANWTVGPYLQNASPTSMTICFVSDHVSDVSAIVKDVAKKEVVSHSAVGVVIPGTTATVWKVRLKGLTSGREYEYHLKYKAGEKEVVDKKYKFKTPSLNADSTRCIVINDVHNRTATVEALMKHVSDDDYEYSILLGDCWNDPSWRGDGKHIMTTLAEFVRLLNGHEKPMLYVRGNHECRGYFSGKMAYLFDLPNLDPTAAYYQQNYYYSFAAGPLRFLFTDVGEDGNKRFENFKPYRLRQSKWLENEIKKPEYRSGKYHIHASHIPLYNISPWRAGYCQGIWSSPLAKADIDLSLGAHDHQWRDLKKKRICDNNKCDKYNKAEGALCLHSPPYPLLIGGGPSLGNGTVMLLKADQKSLSVRMQNCHGRTLSDFSTAR